MPVQKLFTPLKVGAVTTNNRIFMAPMTRARSAEPGDLPTALMGQYYAQRASAGLIITEATQISFEAKGWAGAPGVHTPGADRCLAQHQPRDSSAWWFECSAGMAHRAGLPPLVTAEQCCTCCAFSVRWSHPGASARRGRSILHRGRRATSGAINR